MNNQTETPESEPILMFGEKPVRIVMFDGVPHFSLQDICEAAGWSPFVAQKVESRLFPAHGKRPVEEVSGDGTREVTYLTPVGVWWFTDLAGAKRGERVAAWAKRESRRLCSNPRPGAPAMYLTLNADLSLPPRPLKYSGRRSEWYDLRDSAAYADRYRFHPRVQMQQEIMDRLEAAGCQEPTAGQAPAVQPQGDAA